MNRFEVTVKKYAAKSPNVIRIYRESLGPKTTLIHIDFKQKWLDFDCFTGDSDGKGWESTGMLVKTCRGKSYTEILFDNRNKEDKLKILGYHFHKYCLEIVLSHKSLFEGDVREVDFKIL